MSEQKVADHNISHNNWCDALRQPGVAAVRVKTPTSRSRFTCLSVTGMATRCTVLTGTDQLTEGSYFIRVGCDLLERIIKDRDTDLCQVIKIL